MFESDYVVFFPRSGGAYQIEYFLKTYGGLEKDQTAKIMNLPSRSVILKKTYPTCIIYQNGVFIP